MGEMKIGADTELLEAILGSCVAIAFLWARGGCCGLAHCLLPEPPQPRLGFGARYVSQAIPSLLALMGAREADYPDIQVVVAGGASMFEGRSAAFQVGRQNVAAVEKHLKQRGLKVSHGALGGRCGRQIMVDCAKQNFLITEIEGQHGRGRHGDH